MNTIRFGFTSILMLVAGHAFAQHDHSTQIVQPLTFEHVLTQQLADPELKDFKLQSLMMTVSPAAVDTVKHRHDAELFGYVLEGSLQIGLESDEPKTYAAGQMFYERRNILHSLLRNTSHEKPAKVLLLYIIKNGRTSYIREYPQNAGKR